MYSLVSSAHLLRHCATLPTVPPVPVPVPVPAHTQVHDKSGRSGKGLVKQSSSMRRGSSSILRRISFRTKPTHTQVVPDTTRDGGHSRPEVAAAPEASILAETDRAPSWQQHRSVLKRAATARKLKLHATGGHVLQSPAKMAEAGAIKAAEDDTSRKPVFGIHRRPIEGMMGVWRSAASLLDAQEISGISRTSSRSTHRRSSTNPFLDGVSEDDEQVGGSELTTISAEELERQRAFLADALTKTLRLEMATMKGAIEAAVRKEVALAMAAATREVSSRSPPPPP